MQAIAQAFGAEIGYSDHTPSIEAAIAATPFSGLVCKTFHDTRFEPDTLG
jgi:sialic acid synthase SpsE